jgi:hypothetical protein
MRRGLDAHSGGLQILIDDKRRVFAAQKTARTRRFS